MRFTKIAAGHSTDGLLKMQGSIYAAHQADLQTPPDKTPFHEVYEHRDWIEQSDAIEHELRKRGVHFLPVPWKRPIQ